MTAPPLRVAHVVLSLELGGLERIVVELARRADRARFEPLVCALERSGPLAADLERSGVAVHVVGREPGGFDPGAVARLSRLLSRERVAIVHTHNPAPHLYGSLAAALTRRVLGRLPRVVHTKHGRNVPHTPVNVAVSRIATALTDRVVAVGEDACRVARDVDRAPADRLELVHNGVDLSLFSPGGPRAEAKTSLGLPASCRVVGCVARLSPEKGHDVLLDAFARLFRRVPDARLVLVGDGPCRADLEARARALGIDRLVTFAGARRDVAFVLAAFDVFALASFTEGICLGLLEAAASGLPLVATAVGGNTEILVDEVTASARGTAPTGVVVPPRDVVALASALERVLTNPDRDAMGRAARAHVRQRFSAAAMVTAYERIYADVLAPLTCRTEPAGRAPHRKDGRKAKPPRAAEQRTSPTLEGGPAGSIGADRRHDTDPSLPRSPLGARREAG